MDAIPQDWIPKIFACMKRFYGERWCHLYDDRYGDAEFYKTIWYNGLQGLSYTEIKNALQLCKRHALSPAAKPPHVMEFFKYAKGFIQPPIDYHPKAQKISNPEIASAALKEIRARLR